MSRIIELHEIAKNRFYFLEDNLSIEVCFHHGVQRWMFDVEGKSYPSGSWRVLDRGYTDNLDEMRLYLEWVLKVIKYGDCNVVIISEVDRLFEEAVFNET